MAPCFVTLFRGCSAAYALQHWASFWCRETTRNVVGLSAAVQSNRCWLISHSVALRLKAVKCSDCCQVAYKPPAPDSNALHIGFGTFIASGSVPGQLHSAGLGTGTGIPPCPEPWV